GGIAIGFARSAALVLATIGAAVGGFMIWDHFDDKAAVEAADSKRRLKEANRALEGERRAPGS
ncbi:hypothetical protein, partial [Erythrobacter sp. HI0074]|uniref:hypothetical protein n=1 Tax=Erythrobacter sp. HI0074 TaxID=1822249 RepID=UPI000A81B7B9